ncbi:MAG: nucleotidyl transferase AbiEii/AbiGii toxin family protein [Candidatus Neomarinimicrobiota bacterium]
MDLKDEAIQIARQSEDPRSGKNRMREYLQHVILRELFELNAHRQIIFHGGTALRILHGLRRFSEDLDFHVDLSQKADGFEAIFSSLVRRLEKQNYTLTASPSLNKPVLTLWLGFTGLLLNANLSPHKNAVLSVKIEIDTNPPEGYQTENSIVNTYFPFAIRHHDLKTFLSGKLHALLRREFTKGRDFYDLLFYLSRWSDLSPNFLYLNNALKQSGELEFSVDESNWRNVVFRKVEQTDFNIVLQDVSPFIQNIADLPLISIETFRSLLKPIATP